MNYQREAYYYILVAALIRGKLCETFRDDIRFTKGLHDLSFNQMKELISIGKENDIKLHKFKITTTLPRVQKVLGILKAIQPKNILDIGSGKGTFLWPLVNQFQDVKIECIDILKDRVEEINCVGKGGIINLSAHIMDATQLNFPDNSFDVITALEVLEHIPDYKKAVSEIVRVSRKYIIISVPSKADDNPEHIRLFNKKMIENDFKNFCVTSIKFDQVLNHYIVLIKK